MNFKLVTPETLREFRIRYDKKVFKTEYKSTCLVCSKEFTYFSFSKGRKTCSKECLLILRKISYKKSELRIQKCIEAVRKDSHRKSQSENMVEFFKNNPEKLKTLREKLILRNTGKKLSHDTIYKILKSKEDYFNSDKFEQDKKNTSQRLGEYVRNNPKYQKGVQNQSSKEWRIRSPLGNVYIFKNLRNFLSKNPHLFEKEDVKWKIQKRCKYNKYIEVEICNAFSLAALRPSINSGNRSSSWKGWTWYSEEERILNDGKDLLERKLEISK